jgi:hypothetical protein
MTGFLVKDPQKSKSTRNPESYFTGGPDSGDFIRHITKAPNL